jgi:Mycobacterium membrane protein
MPDPRRRRVWPWVLGGLVLVVLLGIGGFFVFVDRVAHHVEEGSKYQVPVTYRVEGSGSSVGITYTVGVAHTATDTAASLPWTKDIATGGTVSLSARNDQSGGMLTCRIFANGKQIAEQTVTGPLATASCSGDGGLLPAR